MLYHYRAADDQGRVRQGRLAAINPADLEMRLMRLGLTLIECRHRRALLRRKISRRDLIVFCFHLEQLTRAGFPLLESLIDLREHLAHPAFREVISGIVSDIEGGQTLSQALAAHPDVFDPVFVNLVAAGEVSGTLPVVLNNLTESLKWQDELLAQMHRVLMYPAFVALLMLAVLLFLLLYLLPQLVEFMRSMQQPIAPGLQLLMGLSMLLTRCWWLMLGLPLLGVAGLRWRWARDEVFRTRLHGYLLRLPMMGAVLHKIVLARFASCFALLYAAGIPVLDGLRITQGVVGNLTVAQALQQIANRIHSGQSLSNSFASVGLFPPLLVRMLHVGESTGALDHALHNVAYFYQRDISESIARVQAMIAPLLTVILGAVLAWMMSSVLNPIFDSLGSLR
ncbi:type II secretion system F family protein [Chitinibacter sp. S2-10]|uniref:type II secretion system F family protein n=1 Tax=Chitinibacter sp. S2-10 TaxID=3373597 RepID=UPI0039776E9B